MLRETGVRGVRVQEVLSLDDEMLALLPYVLSHTAPSIVTNASHSLPIHALIFCFKYKDADQTEGAQSASCSKHIWFANQVPDFACASVALLNIINNIKGLQIGSELRDFREFTKDMDPLSRGDAIDDFALIKQIHNSFARAIDILNADMYVKQKAESAKKREAAAKARASREAKKAEKSFQSKPQGNAKAAATSISNRMPQTNGAKRPAIVLSGSSSPLSDPPDSDDDFGGPVKANGKLPKHTNETKGPERRSERKPKPRQNGFADSAVAAAKAAEDEDGFHFVAYMPIDGRVWRMDGLDHNPQDLGEIDTEIAGDWMSIATPALQTRMAMFEGAEIEFNLMAVVHDPDHRCRSRLARNVKEIQLLEKALDAKFESWREKSMTLPSRDDVIGPSTTLDLTQADIDGELLDHANYDRIAQGDFAKLMNRREELRLHQKDLIGGVREMLLRGREDEEKARHRRHDYGTFVRSWLGALAEHGLLSTVLEAD